MYDAGKIFLGLIIFLGLLSFPVWYNTAQGTTAPNMPELEMPAGEKQCVESVEYMRAEHMTLLYDWRESVVRENHRKYTASDGKIHTKSLSRNCMSCHVYETFCNRCHSYTGISVPYCWDCHVDPNALEKEGSHGD